MSEEIGFNDAVMALSGVKEMLIKTVQDNPQNPSVHNIVRQAIDHLDATYLFTSSLKMALESMDAAAEAKAKEEIAKGNVMEFPNGEEAPKA